MYTYDEHFRCFHKEIVDGVCCGTVQKDHEVWTCVLLGMSTPVSVHGGQQGLAQVPYLL